MGSYLNVKVEKTANTLDKFDSKTGSRLMNVHSTPQDNEEQLTLFLPTNNNSWLSKKLGKYEEEPEVMPNVLMHIWLTLYQILPMLN